MRKTESQHHDGPAQFQFAPVFIYLPIICHSQKSKTLCLCLVTSLHIYGSLLRCHEAQVLGFSYLMCSAHINKLFPSCSSVFCLSNLQAPKQRTQEGRGEKVFFLYSVKTSLQWQDRGEVKYHCQACGLQHLLFSIWGKKMSLTVEICVEF